MIWLRLKKLETKLINNDISEKTSFQYLLIYLVLIALVMTIPGKEEFSHWGWKAGKGLLDLVITVVGTYLVFSINSKGDNRDFVKRYLSLSFVNGLRLVLLILLLELLYKVVMFIIPLELWQFFNELFSGDIPVLLYPILTSLVYYWLLMRSFIRVNESRYEMSATT